MTIITVPLHADRYTFSIIYRSVLLRMKNIPHKCIETGNTHFVLNKFFFFENHAVYEIMWKIDVERSRETDDCVVHEHCMVDS